MVWHLDALISSLLQQLALCRPRILFPDSTLSTGYSSPAGMAQKGGTYRPLPGIITFPALLVPWISSISDPGLTGPDPCYTALI
jgi:hypothetical protein